LVKRRSSTQERDTTRHKMPVLDEFGREIPSVSGGGGSVGSGGDGRRQLQQGHDNQHPQRFHGGNNNDRHHSNSANANASSNRDANRHDRLSSSLSSSRYGPPVNAPPPPPQHAPPAHHGGGGSVGRYNSNNDRYSSRDDRGGDRGGGRGGGGGSSRGRGRGGGSGSGSGRHREYYSPSRGGGGGGDDHHSSSRRSNNNRAMAPNNAAAASQQQQQQQHKYPAMRYVSEPMLCEYLWKSSQNKDSISDVKASGGGDNAGAAEEEQQASPAIKAVEDEDAAKDKESTDIKTKQEDDDDGDDDKDPDNNKTNPTTTMTTTYDDYRASYGWKFLQHFFNHHLDDSWFRQLYSPAHQCKLAQQEKKRAQQEAAAMQSEIIVNTTNNNDNNNDGDFSFVQAARLGGGVKQQRYQPHQHSNNNNSNQQQQSQQQNLPPQSHLFSTTRRTLEIRDIPPHVADSQILTALPSLPVNDGNHDSNNNSKRKNSKQQQQPQQLQPAADVVQLYSSTPLGKKSETIGSGSSSTNSRSLYLYRTAYVVCPDVATCDTLWRLLQDHPSATTTTDAGAASAGGGSSSAAAASSTHIPRKDERHGSSISDSSAISNNNNNNNNNVTILLEVDCRDPYGRTEYDADGAGGPPEDGLAIPPRKAILRLVRHLDLSAASQQPSSAVQGHDSLASSANSSSSGSLYNSVVVLSASLSTTARIAGDQEAAATIARALDIRQGIPVECRLDTLLGHLQQQFPTSRPGHEDEGTKEQEPQRPSVTTADLLDVSLAYLRRVHLMSFYKGCRKAESFANVLAGQEAASQIQLRLQNADEYLQQQHQSRTAATQPAATAEDDTPADENKAADEAADTETPPTTKAPQEEQVKDMLVQLLEDGIRIALEVSCHEWMASGSSSTPLLVDETADSAAAEIANLEQDARATWLERHAIHDEEGRARCSYHFCHKLFKDQNFLRKHLLKKHAAYCVAEQAKCHDAFMMRTWEDTSSTCSKLLASSSAAVSNSMEQSHQRPWFMVPPILVDCGTKFGFVESTLEAATPSVGAGTDDDVENKRNPQPMAADPEPLLWKHQEERRLEAEEMRQQKRGEARQRFQQIDDSKQQHRMNQHHEQHHQAVDLDSPLTARRSNNNSSNKTFVDVDDMQEEVVEMSFEAVDLPPPAATSTSASGTNKKKKKRKLL
jgi:SERRATE/Ars2, N-terminal domain